MRINKDCNETVPSIIRSHISISYTNYSRLIINCAVDSFHNTAVQCRIIKQSSNTTHVFIQGKCY